MLASGVGELVQMGKKKVIMSWGGGAGQIQRKRGEKMNLLWSFQLLPERYMEREEKASNGSAVRRQL